MFKPYFFFLDCLVLKPAGFLNQVRLPKRNPTFHRFMLRATHLFPEYMSTKDLLSVIGICEDEHQILFSAELCIGLLLIRYDDRQTLGEK